MNESRLVINKSKVIVWREAMFLALMLFSVFASAWILFRGRKITVPDTITAIIILVMAMGFLVFIISQLRKMRLKVADHKINITTETIFINDKLLCFRTDINAIVIHAADGWEGVGVSYVVGIGYLKRFYPLSFYHNLRDAEQIAGAVAEFFEMQVVHKKSKVISWFKGF